jgi:flavodoxin/predicted small lipoprotein YifL
MMKRTVALLLTGMLLFTLAACGMQSETPSALPSESAGQATPSGNEVQSVTPGSDVVTAGDSNILVAYFSSAGNIATDEPARGNLGKGNTKHVAELIQAQTGGDLFFIETVEKYPSNYNDAIGAAMQELRADARPALASHVENMDSYDVIFLGYPNWWGTIPRAILSFIEENDFAGKTVIPFCTYEDSGIGRSISDLEKALPNSTFLKEFSVSEHDLPNAEEAIQEWLAELNFAKIETTASK